MKWTKMIGLALLSLACLGVILVFEFNSWPAGSSLAGIALGFTIPACGRSAQDLFDTTNWKVSQRKLKRG